MMRWIPIAGLLLALTAVAALAGAPEEKAPATPPEATSPILSLKANMGGQKMEMEVDQSEDGLTVKGTLDEQTITAHGKRQPDGTVRVEVISDDETMLEMTINPKALGEMEAPSAPKTKP
ncbi:MAG: hypothetical protein ACE5H5_02765 [Nitrospinota bacterium]